MKVERGFTLIELMVTVAIIGIIVAVGYPSYTQHIARTHRKAAQSVMHTLLSKQEMVAVAVEGYTTDLAKLNVNLPAEVTARYTITLATNAGPPPWHSVRAVPFGEQAAADAKCGTLTLKSTGEKEQTGVGTDCWR